MASPKTGPDTFVVCQDCGSESISGSASVYWNAHKQDWDTENIDNFYCSDCANECGVEDVHTIQLFLFEWEQTRTASWRAREPEWYTEHYRKEWYRNDSISGD